MTYEIIQLNSRAKDITGNTYGYLSVIAPVKSDSNRQMLWLCKCVCGDTKIILARHLKSGTKSCGCKTKQMQSNRKKTHGMSKSKEFRIWTSMKNRCSNINDHTYYIYGGRGIGYCESWKSFDVFYTEMGDCPNKYTLERVNNNLGYSADNCKWATRKEQANNRRSCHLITVSGITMNVTQWSESLGISRATLYSRIRSGWSNKKIVSTPIDTRFSH